MRFMTFLFQTSTRSCAFRLVLLCWIGVIAGCTEEESCDFESDCGEADVLICEDGTRIAARCEPNEDGACAPRYEECPSVQTCATVADCSPAQFCRLAAMTCTGEGICVTPPVSCTSDFEPVCGCDGETYSNRCAANAASVSIAAEGPCDAPAMECGPELAQCPMGMFCERTLEASCDESMRGRCREIPTSCPPDESPVCGCDEVTYANRCEAKAAGVSISSEGDCSSEVATCVQGADDCAEGSFCLLPADAACEEGARGECVPRPTRCDEDDSPVCGCDGETYESACAAHAEGISIVAAGSCAPMPQPIGEACGGRGLGPCVEGSFCNFAPESICGRGDAGGICTARPDRCEPSDAPVCGCDGVTYASACAAARAGVSVERDGRCEVERCQPREPNACGEEAFCNVAIERRCGEEEDAASAECAARPERCLERFEPVCGCDGENYDSECQAQAAGTSAGWYGTCERPIRAGERCVVLEGGRPVDLPNGTRVGPFVCVDEGEGPDNSFWRESTRCAEDECALSATGPSCESTGIGCALPGSVTLMGSAPMLCRSGAWINRETGERLCAE